MLGRIIGCHARGKIGNHGMFSLIRPTKVEGHGGSAGHIHHSQGGKLLQLLRKERVKRITEVREAEERRLWSARKSRWHGRAGKARAEEGRREGTRREERLKVSENKQKHCVSLFALVLFLFVQYVTFNMSGHTVSMQLKPFPGLLSHLF